MILNSDVYLDSIFCQEGQFGYHPTIVSFSFAWSTQKILHDENCIFVAGMFLVMFPNHLTLLYRTDDGYEPVPCIPAVTVPLLYPFLLPALPKKF